ncbi:MAG: hypothetical protein HY057_12205 [Rhodospirillales bacterium]|nr:hypothetical protein [Rhodospirillales bacterium]
MTLENLIRNAETGSPERLFGFARACREAAQVLEVGAKVVDGRLHRDAATLLRNAASRAELNAARRAARDAAYAGRRTEENIRDLRHRPPSRRQPLIGAANNDEAQPTSPV